MTGKEWLRGFVSHAILGCGLLYLAPGCSENSGSGRSQSSSGKHASQPEQPLATKPVKPDPG